MTQNSMILPCKTLKNPIFFLARFARRHPQRSREALINSPKSSQSGREALIEGGLISNRVVETEWVYGAAPRQQMFESFDSDQ